MDYSPLLAIATGLFEFAAAILTHFSPGRKRILYPIGLLFLLLAGYQFSEVAVCANPEKLIFSRLAFLDITWLPPLALWLAYQLSPWKRGWLKIISLGYFAASFGFMVWIIVDSHVVTKSVCQLVLARYTHPNSFDIAYGIFYQTGLAIIIFGTAAGMAYSKDDVLRKHLANLQISILGFVLPSFAVRLLTTEPEGMLPSVMCHFALVLAFSMCFMVIREKRLSLKQE
jgi:hypothetical protein